LPSKVDADGKFNPNKRSTRPSRAALPRAILSRAIQVEELAYGPAGGRAGLQASGWKSGPSGQRVEEPAFRPGVEEPAFRPAVEEPAFRPVGGRAGLQASSGRAGLQAGVSAE